MAASLYQKKLDALLLEMQAAKKKNPDLKKPGLLLHACCAPCSSYVLEYLSGFFEITILYYNPNIFPPEEYKRRLSELENFLPEFSPAVSSKVKLVKADYNPEEFYAALGIEKEPELAKEAEKGERCRRCYELRLKFSYDYAFRHGFEYFCTTLSISPFKDAKKINEIGEKLAESALKEAGENALETGGESLSKVSVREIERAQAAFSFGKEFSAPKWLYSDFKKHAGFLRSLELSEEYGLYRQQYCGCVFSKNNTEKAREEKL